MMMMRERMDMLVGEYGVLDQKGRLVDQYKRTAEFK